MEEGVDRLAQKAGELGLLGCPMFVFHEGRDPVAERAFREFARVSKGAYARFDANAPKELAALLRAVAAYAAGGRPALQLQQTSGRQAAAGAARLMQYVLFAGVGLLAIGIVALDAAARPIRATSPRCMRWIVGGIAALTAGFFLLRGRIEIARVLGGVAFSILRFGRLGPISFESDTPSDDNASAVRSRYIAMTLDHATGEVTGKVIYGEFQGIDLINLGENETRRLLDAVAGDPDSLSLLETWLDKNRAGWREWFASAPRARSRCRRSTRTRSPTRCWA